MGIRGLERYLEQNNREACYIVNIKELILSYKNQTGQAPKIVIDGMSVMNRLYTSKLTWIHGGQLREFYEVLREFITAFIDLGAELVAFFDGPAAINKREAWIKRRLETLSDVYGIFDDLSNGVDPLMINNNRKNVLPANVGIVIMHIFHLYGCKVYKSILECDKEISSYAWNNGCLAILAQDSDFVIYEGAQYYWSMKNFNINTMTTYNYDRVKFANSLRLSPAQLPLLASLMGNDIVSSDIVMPFKKMLLRNFSRRNYIDFSACLMRVSDYVRRFPLGVALNNYLPQIAKEVFCDESKALLLYNSINSYNTSGESNDVDSSGNDHWDAILKLARENHIHKFTPACIYSIIVHQRYWASTSLEDVRYSSDLLPKQIILKKIRQHIYGILLMEKPLQVNKNTHEVRELVVSSPNSLNEDAIVQAIPPTVKHPGLVALWNENDLSLSNERWGLVCDAVQGVNPSSLLQLPPHLIVPSLSLLYLLKNGLPLNKWEINAVISCNIILRELSVDNLKLLPTDVADSRAVRLQTIITGAYTMIITLLQVCGNPLQFDYVVPTNYQDGKLFHLKYMEAKNGSSVSKLLHYNVNNIETFNIIHDFINVS